MFIFVFAILPPFKTLRTKRAMVIQAEFRCNIY